jgi:hypothetical protein
MPFKPNRPIAIDLLVQSTHPALLEGLDEWLRLGLITDDQVRKICHESLACPLAQAPIASVEPAAQVAVTTPERIPEPIRDFVIETEPTRPASTPIRPPQPRPQTTTGISRLLEGLMAEISVLWLLLLGVFLVVISSAVLAASQWQNFSSTGQYTILFAYTLAFWGASYWLGKQPNLQLTSRMLQVATLLIVPLNFWMMDGFRLWQGVGGLFVAAIAAAILTTITFLLLNSTTTAPAPLNYRWVMFNSVALSWLHWGWGGQGFPLVATYMGTVGTASLLFFQLENRDRNPQNQPSTSRQASTVPVTPSLGLIALAFGVLLLLIRAIFVAQLPITRLSLAIGICGWLLCWLARRDRIPRDWSKPGVALLLLGWLVGVTATAPWQATIISGFGIWLLVDRLQRSTQIENGTALFLVGLQTLWLCWRVVPAFIQQSIVDFFISIAGSEAMPQALLGLGVFPYVALTLWSAVWLRRQQKNALADHAEVLALLLGIILTLVSLGNPLVRSLNLLLSFVALASVTRRRTNALPGLIYLTHITGLLAIISSIGALLPDLNTNIWAGILLAVMLLEWGFSATSDRPIWRQSAWYFGLGLAAASYVLLLNSVVELDDTWSGMWLVAPTALTLLVNRSTFFYPRVTVVLSSVALILVQPLMLSSPTTRLLGWGAATILMLLNTRQLQSFFTAALTVGFALGFAAISVWESRAGDVSIQLAMNLLAGATLVLWLLQSLLVRRHTRLSRLYAVAVDRWAVAIATGVLMLLTVYTLFLYWFVDSAEWELVLAAVIVLAAISYRSWHHYEDLNFYGIGWSLELTLAGLIVLSGRSLELLATANIALALLLQLAGDWRSTRHPAHTSHPTPHYLSSWHVIPILYALIGFGIQHREFTTYTGIYTIAAALVGIGVGRRRAEFKSLTYLSVLGISAGAYELLVYQLMQAEAGAAGDGIVLLAALATALAIAIRLLARWLSPYFKLSLLELKAISYLHWVAGSGLQVLAVVNPLSFTGEWLWTGVTAILAGYALANGRQSESTSRLPVNLTRWTWAGIAEGLAAIAYYLSLLLPSQVLTEWGGAIACVVAYGMYVAPWERWGWLKSPWQNAAMLLPAVVVLLTSWDISIASLLIVGAFYAWIARLSEQTRLSYLSVLLANWAIVRLMLNNAITDPLWYSMLLGASLLYVAQVDPALRSVDDREKRHLLRCFAVGLVCLTALNQSDNSILLSLFTLVFSLGLIVAGLVLKVRAFLYIGTLAFIIKVLRQVWIFIYDYSLALWAIGIVLGLLFIWVAATFEARRSQVIALLQYWLDELQAWE